MLGRAEVEDNLGVLSVDVQNDEITVLVRNRVAGTVWCECFRIDTARHPKVLARALWRVLRGAATEPVLGTIVSSVRPVCSKTYVGLCIKPTANETGDRRDIVIEPAFRAVVEAIRKTQVSQPALPLAGMSRPTGAPRDGRRRL